MSTSHKRLRTFTDRHRRNLKSPAGGGGWQQAGGRGRCGTRLFQQFATECRSAMSKMGVRNQRFYDWCCLMVNLCTVDPPGETMIPLRASGLEVSIGNPSHQAVSFAWNSDSYFSTFYSFPSYLSTYHLTTQRWQIAEI